MKRIPSLQERYDPNLDIYDEYCYWDRARINEFYHERKVQELNARLATPYFTIFAITNFSLLLLTEMQKYIKNLYVLSPSIIYMKHFGLYFSQSYPFMIDTFQTTVIQLKEMIFKRDGIPSDQLRLIYEGKGLADDKLLSSYNVLNGKTIHITIATRGD